jgi:hypothetical protein
VQGVRKIVVYELLSLDGVAEKPDSFFADWGCCIFGFPGFQVLLLAELVYGTPVQAG